MKDIIYELLAIDEERQNREPWTCEQIAKAGAAEIERLRELVKAAYVEGALDFGGFCDRTHTVAEDRYSGSDVARWVDDVDAWESDNAG